MPADGSLPTPIRSIVRTVCERSDVTLAREAMRTAQRDLDCAFADFSAECRDRASSTPDEIGRDFAMLVELGEQAYARAVLVRRKVMPSQAYDSRVKPPIHRVEPWATQERQEPTLYKALCIVETELDDLCTGEALAVVEAACKLAHATAKLGELTPPPAPRAPTDLGLRVAA